MDVPSQTRDDGGRGTVDGLVLLSVRRSQARSEVLAFLARRGPSYVTLIAEGTGLRVNTVSGALNGAGERYSQELSLVSLGLVEEVEPGPVPTPGISRFYTLTDEGRAVVAALQNGEGHRADVGRTSSR